MPQPELCQNVNQFIWDIIYGYVLGGEQYKMKNARLPVKKIIKNFKIVTVNIKPSTGSN